MQATWKLHNLGQSLWLDNITRELLESGTLSRYINDFLITGLTSNPTIYERAIQYSDRYDDAIREKLLEGRSGEALLFELAIDDLVQAADLFLPIHALSEGRDGWVSLEVSPLLADDTVATIKAAIDLHTCANRPNLFIKIPGTCAGIAAIEEVIFFGVPVNVTLLFSREHYLAAANAYCRGVERRIAAGLNPKVGSVASIFISRWDVAVNDKIPRGMRNQLGIAVAMRTYKAYCDLLASPRWQRLAEAGAQNQRLLWASTGTKDPDASQTLYIEALAAPGTINTMPEKTLLALATGGRVIRGLPVDGGAAESRLAAFTRLGVNVAELAEVLQFEGKRAFSESWAALLAGLRLRAEALEKTNRVLE